MNLDTFFEKFELLANLPNAVGKMRELILQLAVRGRLVEQDLADEPAVDLLERIRQFKELNPLDGRSGRSKEKAQTSVPESSLFPANWAMTSIGEILHVVRGASPRPKGDPLYFSEQRTAYHWVKISDIRKHSRNGLLLDTDEFLTEAGMKKSVLLPKGTLVLTNSATIGVPIVLGIDGCCIHDGYLAFPKFPESLLSQKFFLYLFYTLKEHAEQNARGLAQLNLNTDLVRSFTFGLPPLAEQKRIVAKVDELMALCDRLEAQQKQREAQQAALVQASLTRFTDAPTSTNLEFLFHNSYAVDPSEMRKIILACAADGCFAGGVSTEPVLMEDLVGKANLRNGLSLKPVSGVSAFSCLPLSAMRAGRIDCSSGKFIDITAKDAEPYLVRKGDVFLIRGNGSRDLVGRAGMVATEPKNIIFPDLFIRVPLPAQRIMPEYFVVIWNSPPLREQLVNLAKTTSGIWKVNQGHISQCKIPLPPLAEQKRIVAKVEELMGVVDRLEGQLAASREVGAKLIEAVVAEIAAAA